VNAAPLQYPGLAGQKKGLNPRCAGSGAIPSAASPAGTSQRDVLTRSGSPLKKWVERAFALEEDEIHDR